MNEFLRTITLQDHPAEVKTLYAEDADIREAAIACRHYIQEKSYSAVAIIRPSTHLENTWSKAAIGLKDRNFPYDHSFNAGAGAFYFRDIHENYNQPPIIYNDATLISENYGHDFEVFSSFSQILGPSTILIRDEDGRNRDTHLDRGESFTESENLSYIQFPHEKLLPYAVTATMSVHGGGTEFVEGRKEEFRRITRNDKKIWGWHYHYIEPERRWQAKDGDILIMRSEAWDEERLPALHNSPERMSDGDSSERVVGVSFICGF